MDELLWSLEGFQWDDGNSEKNYKKHCVHFTECEQVFFNRPIFVSADVRHSESERRYAALGVTDRNRRLAIVFTIRGNLIRVISARDMDRKERNYYENQN
ncbi:MAG: BrnT family toxin [Chitinispirillaceae bacterium]|nr:BrnT family toxin [Chitinispirillaceae bacterium]